LFSQTVVSLVQPSIVLGVTSTNQTANPSSLILDSPSPTDDGALIVGFSSEPNQTYYLQYSGDLNTWKTVKQPVIGVGSHIQWTDDGPPKTDALPQTQARRLYRILHTP
jgi:hypothetical protein